MKELSIRPRLREWLAEKRVSIEELAVASGLPESRLLPFCDADTTFVDLSDAAAILAALGSDRLSDLFEVIASDDDAGYAGDVQLMSEAAWHSACSMSIDGKHKWYKDLAVSDTVYQEYVCQACRRRLSVIL